MQAIWYGFLFVLLLVCFLCWAGINPLKHRHTISLSKQVLQEKRKKVDDALSKPTLPERLAAYIGETIRLCGSSHRAYAVFTTLCAIAGFGVGMGLFGRVGLAIIAALCALPVPLLSYRVRSRWYRRSQNERLEHTMATITNAYIGSNDLLSAINDNLDKLEVREPFSAFILDVTLIDASIPHALRRLEAKIRHPLFSEWIDILMLCQEKSGDMRYALPAVVESMNDAKRLQIESDTVMLGVWREFFMAVALSFSIIPLLRYANAQWFAILVGSFFGKCLLTAMLVYAVVAAFVVLRINRPLA